MQYKTYLLKSGYSEESTDKKFINFATRNNRKNIMKNKKKKKKEIVRKYRFVTEFEVSFPDKRKGFQKFEHIIKEDEVLIEVFSEGVRHFQICQKRGFKNIKKFLAASSTKLKLEEHK